MGLVCRMLKVLMPDKTCFFYFCTVTSKTNIKSELKSLNFVTFGYEPSREACKKTSLVIGIDFAFEINGQKQLKSDLNACELLCLHAFKMVKWSKKVK